MDDKTRVMVLEVNVQKLGHGRHNKPDFQEAIKDFERLQEIRPLLVSFVNRHAGSMTDDEVLGITNLLNDFKQHIEGANILWPALEELDSWKDDVIAKANMLHGYEHAVMAFVDQMGGVAKFNVEHAGEIECEDLEYLKIGDEAVFWMPSRKTKQEAIAFVKGPAEADKPHT